MKIKLYFIPMISVLCGVISYWLVYQGLSKTRQILTPITQAQNDNQESLLDTQRIARQAVDSDLPQQEEQESKGQELEPLKPIYRVSTAILNIRQDSNEKARVVGRLHQNDKVEVLEIVGEWAKISNGWVKLEYLNKE